MGKAMMDKEIDELNREWCRRGYSHFRRAVMLWWKMDNVKLALALFVAFVALLLISWLK